MQLEQDFEIASNEYEYINSALKSDLPKFFVLATRFIDPLFHSFFYMQSVSIHARPSAISHVLTQHHAG